VSSLPSIALLAIFAASAGVIWVAGIRLSATTDVLSTRFGLGEALGGLILLALATNLPEAAITCTAALSHNFGIAIGNILGGVAIQTVVLAILDFADRRDAPLSYRGASLTLVLEATLVVAVLIVAIMGSRLPSSQHAAHLEPGSVVIVALWVGGLLLINRARKGLPWQEKGTAPGAQAKPRGHSAAQREKGAGSTRVTVIAFAVASVATLAAGVAIEESGNALAGKVGMSGVIFGSTVLAAATALPELSTGLGSVRLGDVQLAFSDIFGGNAFLPVLFFLATLISGDSVLPRAQDTDVYMAGLGILLTCVYIYGLLFRPRRRVLGMGVDSLCVVVLYLLGIVGLATIGGG
jgi:cation:H+ antiporter